MAVELVPDASLAVESQHDTLLGSAGLPVDVVGLVYGSYTPLGEAFRFGAAPPSAGRDASSVGHVSPDTLLSLLPKDFPLTVHLRRAGSAMLHD